MEYIYEYYVEHGKYPSLPELKNYLYCFRDLIAYRIVISLPKCHLKKGENVADEEMKYLYDVANKLPDFLEQRGFTAEMSSLPDHKKSPLLNESVSPYYRDYIANLKSNDYRSLHITFYDSIARCYVELQLRTKQNG